LPAYGPATLTLRVAEITQVSGVANRGHPLLVEGLSIE
jgi:hypothetical protein